MSVILSEGNQSEKVIGCMIAAAWRSGKGKTTDNRKRSGHQEEGMERMFQGSKSIVYSAVMADTWHY